MGYQSTVNVDFGASTCVLKNWLYLSNELLDAYLPIVWENSKFLKVLHFLSQNWVVYLIIFTTGTAFPGGQVPVPCTREKGHGDPEPGLPGPAPALCRVWFVEGAPLVLVGVMGMLD